MYEVLQVEGEGFQYRPGLILRQCCQDTYAEFFQRWFGPNLMLYDVAPCMLDFK